MVKGEIIIVGDEILSGEVQDTNSFELAKQLSSAGFFIERITVVGDEQKEIVDVLLTAIKKADFIILTGGLGPTWDDKTVKAVAQALNRPLEINKEAYQHLKACLAKHGKPFLPSHEKMVLLPAGSKPLGLAFHACGFKLIFDEKPLYFLPGVPKQMNQILKAQVLPDLNIIFPNISILYKKTLRIFGISETEVSNKISSLLASFPEIKVSSLPCFPEVHLFLRANKKEDLDKLVKEIKTILGNDIFGEDTETMPEVVGKLLLKKGYHLSVAESLTGGLIGHLITSVSGSSNYFDRGVVTYSNQAKIELLGVPKEIVNKYGPVSEKTARYMAEGVKKLAKSDIGIAVTGYAGPTAGPEAEVGTVFIGLATPTKIEVTEWHFNGDRSEIKMLAAMTALDKLRRYLIL
ncbi:MAG TPA: CinA family nicotinamide mononucleotide deamidase-related protein [Candidatus Desulfofervidus auxilii]|uniref:CinA-like protein n=1 Tax=Desulfofervidus auxilii TaxID=1621989 RepID=A0A7C0U2U8_DESA2|nr:CinA family nicotinamide mononucleotide deamidase-related protein [Candidatus Desulfofervidus auxilii]